MLGEARVWMPRMAARYPAGGRREGGPVARAARRRETGRTGSAMEYHRVPGHRGSEAEVDRQREVTPCPGVAEAGYREPGPGLAKAHTCC